MSSGHRLKKPPNNNQIKQAFSFPPLLFFHLSGPAAEFSIFCSKTSPLRILLISSKLKDIWEDIPAIWKSVVVHSPMALLPWKLKTACHLQPLLPQRLQPLTSCLLLPFTSFFRPASHQPGWKTSFLAAITQQSSPLPACLPLNLQKPSMCYPEALTFIFL